MGPPPQWGSRERVFFVKKLKEIMKNCGAIVIIYKIIDSIYYYLLPTQKSGMINFIGGGREDQDKNFESTIRREIAEETNLEVCDYSLRQTDIVHKFFYHGPKKDRNGKRWENKVFIAEVHPELNISPKGEVAELKWYLAEDAIKLLVFDDMKEVFKKAVKVVEGR